jgi:hypothetical protein
MDCDTPLDFTVRSNYGHVPKEEKRGKDTSFELAADCASVAQVSAVKIL